MADGSRLFVADFQSSKVFCFDLVTGAKIREISSSASTFGWRLSLDDGVLAVTAPYDDSFGFVDSGAIFLFDAASGTPLRTIYSPSP